MSPISEAIVTMAAEDAHLMRRSSIGVVQIILIATAAQKAVDSRQSPKRK